MMQRNVSLRLIWVICILIAGCAAPERTTMTLPQQLRAVPTGFEGIRFFSDSPRRELAPFQSDFRPSGNGRPTYLAISGGGEGGAFGAGVLVGLSGSGNRPSFDLVTGISAGALLAPFAFVGTEADADLQQLFSSDIATRLNGRHSILRGFLGKASWTRPP